MDDEHVFLGIQGAENVAQHVGRQFSTTKLNLVQY
jgi:hypothetical protein